MTYDYEKLLPLLSKFITKTKFKYNKAILKTTVYDQNYSFESLFMKHKNTITTFPYCIPKLKRNKYVHTYYFAIHYS